MVHALCSATDPHARATCSAYPITSMVTTSTSSAVQVHEPRRWPRTVSSMRWTSTRPTRPSVTQSTIMLSRGHRSVGTESDVQPVWARLRAIRKAWQGKAIRKSCTAQADSCEASAKAPVTGCIGILAAAASRFEHGSGWWLAAWCLLGYRKPLRPNFSVTKKGKRRRGYHNISSSCAPRAGGGLEEGWKSASVACFPPNRD
eukprot:scaffold12354_cov54-Phaeocystis_antarctica.AAC.2